MRPTLSDIAQAAGVSLATVDRVMNGRAGVRTGLRDRVLATARRLGYPLAEPASGRDPAPVSLVFLLPRGTNAFIAELGRQVALQAAQMPGVSARVEIIAGFDPETLARRLAALGGSVDGVGLVALDHPLVRAAVRDVASAGTAVVTIASDIRNVPRLAYVGIDNGQAGRLAGHVLGRFLGRDRPAKVALFAGSLSYRGHQEREMGFRQILAEDFPKIDIVAMREIHEDRARARAALGAILDRHPDLGGIYNVGGATAGIAGALRDHNRAGDIVFVAHEATPGNNALLLDGTLDAVIDQNPRVEIREALGALVHAARGTAYAVMPPRLQVVFRENLPDEA